jgi:hypothetical protein
MAANALFFLFAANADWTRTRPTMALLLGQLCAAAAALGALVMLVRAVYPRRSG